MMIDKKKRLTILIAEDDDDDFLLVKEAFEESRLPHEIYRARDGEELLEFLLHKGDFTDRESSPRPMLILLDLNMPKKDGREALAEIKAHPDLRKIPVVILTTSRADEDIIRTYDLGVNSFIRKPVDFSEFVGIIRTLSVYWFEIVELPPG
ncbi:MAG: response regulator [Methanoregula sp.]|nr:response regulator [Methanoregula sp.]